MRRSREITSNGPAIKHCILYITLIKLFMLDIQCTCIRSSKLPFYYGRKMFKRKKKYTEK